VNEVFVNTLFRVCIFAVAGVAMVFNNACASELKSDENIQFFPSPAQLRADGGIQGHIEAWVYENEERPGVNALLARYLDVDIDAMSESEKKLFSERTQLFRVDSQRGKTLRIGFDGKPDIVLSKTSATGRASTLVVFANPAIALPKTQWLNYRARLPTADKRSISGRLLVIPAKGISVVSDIDDTIKISNVLDRKKLLLSTFTKPFVAVQGTAERYREIAKQSDSAFHYVSGSPHHLYPVLLGFLRDAGFPDGTMHLRDLNWQTELFRRGSSSEVHKLNSIRKLMRDFPQRQFIFYGDSGERDPEIYGQLAREFPQQVLEIHIRDVTKQTRDDARYGKAFRDIPAQRWSLSAAES
jgi:Uncharacterized conserved protein (DUF2183)